MFGRWLDNAIAAVVLVAIGILFPKVSLALLAAWLLYQAYVWHTDGAWTSASRVRKKAVSLHEKALKLARDQGAPDADAFIKLVWDRYSRLTGDSFPAVGVASKFLPVIRELYPAGEFTVSSPPPDGTVLELARYCDRISSDITRLSTPGLANAAADTIAEALVAFTRGLPPVARSTRAAFESAVEQGTGSGFSVRLIDALNAGEAVRALSLPFFSSRTIALGLFKELKDQLQRSAREMSGVPHTDVNTAKLVRPTDHKGSSAEVAAGYLGHTPLLGLFGATIPLELPEDVRTEHHWIVAGSGHGKTQTLQYMIGKDLERVARGEASVVVIDSQGDLIKAVSSLKMFAPGEALDGKLCLIDPTDIEYPVALNLFDVGMERISTYKPLDRERLMNGVLELYDFVLSSLLSAELTQKQSVIFRYITRLMLHIPGSTIHTFRELMEPKGYEKYKSHIDKLDGTARAFFETEFNSKQFEDTKRQVVRRLWGILENRTFERMFTHPKNKLDLFSEMNAGKVIVINTAKELLKQTGTEIFGRFFIALIAQAAQERATIDKAKRMPTFVYIDECADYLDQNVALILEQARKYKVGMVLANQYIGQLSPRLLDSFAANTSIKFAGGVSDKDAKALAHMLRATPEFIFDQPKGHFAAAIRGVTNSAVSIEVPFGYLEDLPRMSAQERETVRARIRERYAVFWEEVGRTPDDDPTAPRAMAKPEAVGSEPANW